ncbi:MAG: histidine kinase dimerization/phospho-acceptor domain-containing protein, partial [Pseudomonadota bacterium]
MNIHKFFPTPLFQGPSPRARLIRMRTLTRLRWFAVSGQLLVILFVRVGLGYEVPVGPVLAAIAVGVWFNLYIIFTAMPAHILQPPQLVRHLCFDVAQIGTVLFLTGGIHNPFCVWLILPAMLAASSLERRSALMVMGMVILTLTGLTIWHLPLPWGAQGLSMPLIYDVGTWLAMLLGIGFTASYAHKLATDQSKLSTALETTQNVLAREERLTALGGLAAAAAHELGTPLGTIQVTAKEMERELPDGPLKEDARLLLSQTQRCQRILHRLADTGKAVDARHSVMSLEEILREAAHPFLKDTPIRVEF